MLFVMPNSKKDSYWEQTERTEKVWTYLIAIHNLNLQKENNSLVQQYVVKSSDTKASQHDIIEISTYLKSSSMKIKMSLSP
jgi:hypothetical protein